MLPSSAAERKTTAVPKMWSLKLFSFWRGVRSETQIHVKTFHAAHIDFRFALGETAGKKAEMNLIQ